MTAGLDDGMPSDGTAGRLLLTYEDVAEMFGVTTRTVRNWTRKGLLPALRIHGIVRFRSCDVDALVEPTAPHE